MNNNNNRNNNNNNNRRRGRGNNNRPNGGGGGGQPINRIDSRARGNAPQMLEKYRKMALDSHMNGDRVNEEYYLQFADHYFRVIADTRVRQEETRLRRDDRWQEGGENATGSERDFEYAEDAVDPYEDMRQGGGGDMRAAQDSRQGQDMRQNGERQERYERQERPERAERQDRPERAERVERQERPERASRNERPAPVSAEPSQPSSDLPSDESAPRSVYEPPENPFVRGEREGRGLKQRRTRRDTRDGAEQPVPTALSDEGESRDGDGASDGPSTLDVFDPAILPPAVAIRRPADTDTPTGNDGEAEVKPRRRTRRPRPAADGTDETLQAVS